jgi:tRNA threonylcarbamoyladenosine biosynthesis protein TsaB
MTVILHIESATKPCSVALSKGEELLFFRMNNQANSHAVQLGLIVDEALKFASRRELRIDAVSVSAGPGSYTGLRIGVSMAKGICYGYDVPLIALSTLRILTGQALGKADENTLLCPALDARRMEIYTAVYNHKGEELKPAEALVLEENSFEDFHSDKTLCFFWRWSKEMYGKIEPEEYLLPGSFGAQGKRNATPGSGSFPLGAF